MPGQRYQDPKILTRSDVKRPFYYIQPYVPLFTDGGLKRKRQNISLGFCDAMTMRQAKARKEQIMATINAGKFVVQSQIPFGQVVQRFLDVHVPTLGSATRERYENQIANHILPSFRDMRICDITKPVVQAWLNGRATDHERTIGDVTKTYPALSWWSRWSLRGVLSCIFERAKEWRLWEGDNPAHGVSLGRKKAKRVKRIPRAEDLRTFLESLPENPLIDLDGARLIVIVAVVSGLRVSEVLGLCPADVDVAAGTLKVERRWRRGDEDEPKTEGSKRTRQIRGLANLLVKYARDRKPNEYLFLRKDGRPLDDRDLQRDIFRPAAEAVGIYHEGFGMHVFRALNVTWRQTIGGATPVEAQKQAGHTSLDMTMLYTQTEADRENEQVDKILDHLGIDALKSMTAIGGVQ